MFQLVASIFVAAYNRVKDYMEVRRQSKAIQDSREKAFGSTAQRRLFVDKINYYKNHYVNTSYGRISLFSLGGSGSFANNSIGKTAVSYKSDSKANTGFSNFGFFVLIVLLIVLLNSYYA